MTDITRKILSEPEPEVEEDETEETAIEPSEEGPQIKRGRGRPRKGEPTPIVETRGGARETKSKEPSIPKNWKPGKFDIIPELTVGGVMPGAGGVLIGAVAAGFNPQYIIDGRKFINFKTWDYNFSQYGTRFSMLNESYRDTPLDLIVGSPSCAKFSRRGTKIINGKPLEEVPPEIFEYVQFLEEIVQRRPRFFILENVPGVRRYFWFEKHPDSGYLLKSEKFRTGIWLKDYDIQEEFYDTHDFGLPQYRKRLYLIGALKEYDFLYRPPKYQKIAVVKDVLEDLKDNFGTLVNHEEPEHNEDRIRDFKQLKPGEAAYSSFGNKRLAADAPAPTITGGSTRFIHYDRDRIITPRECARIMGFPDDFIFWGGILQQYDQIGKGVAPPVITHMAKQVMETLQNKGKLRIPEVFKPKKRLLPRMHISFSREA
jgi:DNA (cytosine-5)-methyltransferase 1